VDIDARYVLYLQIEPRKIEFQREECLLDLEWSHPEKCSTTPSVTDLTWTLWSDGAIAADNTSLQTWKAGSYSNDYTRREIGRFDGEGGVVS
jgi:hypothetical protein